MAEVHKISEARNQTSVRSNFGDVLSALAIEKKLTQLEVAERANTSQSMISRLGNGKRNLTPLLAESISSVFGCDHQLLLNVFKETKDGSEKSVNYFREKLLGNLPKSNDYFTETGRVIGDDIKRMFSDDNDGFVEYLGSPHACEISGFNPERSRLSSYDTVVGGYYDSDGLFHEAVEEVSIKSRSSLELGTLEHFTMPSWMEIELHPPSTIARKGLQVEHGPIIDPLFVGRLRVKVINTTDDDQSIKLDEPFLTLRFWIFS